MIDLRDLRKKWKDASPDVKDELRKELILEVLVYLSEIGIITLIWNALCHKLELPHLNYLQIWGLQVVCGYIFKR